MNVFFTVWLIALVVVCILFWGVCLHEDDGDK